MALYDHQKIIKIVGNSARELADRLHFLGLSELLFQPAALGNIGKQAVCISFPLPVFNGHRTVVPPHPVPVAVLNTILDVKGAIVAEELGIGFLHS